MIVCDVILRPLRSSRSAPQPPDFRGRMWFRRVPVKGETIALADDQGDGSDWNRVEADLAGRLYIVSDVTWFAACAEDRNPPMPRVEAESYSRIEQASPA